TADRRKETFKYLEEESLCDCDSELKQILKSRVDDGKQTIADLQASHALPAGTTYFDKLLDFGGMPAVGKKALDDRLLLRRDWFSGTLDALQDTELVFFDPDTGMEIPSMKRHRADGPKYVWYDELKPFFGRGQSLVVYQHGDHSKAEQAIKQRASELRDTLKCEQIWIVRWHRRQSRFYFIIPVDEHIARMEKAIGCLQASSWCQDGHFSVSAVS
ncbi:MAG: hypothetical protein HW388_1057, partial [Dehalococcoidia bacterium]|nr:hypothetical protein [Dehalococcoidia bacterium]